MSIELDMLNAEVQTLRASLFELSDLPAGQVQEQINLAGHNTFYTPYQSQSVVDEAGDRYWNLPSTPDKESFFAHLVGTGGTYHGQNDIAQCVTLCNVSGSIVWESDLDWGPLPWPTPPAA